METDSRPKEPVGKFYVSVVALLMLVLPVVSILAERYGAGSHEAWMPLAGKWFLFWAVGARLFTAGLRQIIRPAFTARDIFHVTDTASYIIVRELGFANVCLGLLAIGALPFAAWRIPAAFAGALFFGAAGIEHCIKKPVSANEWVALVSDLWVFLIMAAFLIAVLPH